MPRRGQWRTIEIPKQREKRKKKKLEKRRRKFVGCLHIWFLAHIHSQGQTEKGCTFFYRTA